MFRRRQPQFCRRSMNTDHPPSGSSSHGESSNHEPSSDATASREHRTASRCQRPATFLSAWSTVFIVLGLLCIFGPQGGSTLFTCPTNCTCDSYKLSGNKVQNISCAAEGLTQVPTDGKEGSDVISLVLSNNEITSVTSTDFQYFTNLVALDLSYNQISSMSDDIFDNLTNLQTLNLAGNTDLTALPPELFENAVNLSYLNVSWIANFQIEDTFPSRSVNYLILLDISHQSLTSLTEDMLKEMTNLEEIYVNNNQISSLQHNVFQNLNLRKIDFSGNLLHEKIKHQHFRSSTLVILDISDNLITDVDYRFLKNNDALTNLDLSNNQITSLDKDTFEQAPALLTIDLSNNALASVHHDLFKDVESVTNLDLSGNQLTTIPTDLFEHQSTVTIDLSNNPFDCDCDVRDALFSLRNQISKTVLNEETTQCTSTDGTEYVYFDYDDTACSNNLGVHCTLDTECMTRNSECISFVCGCRDHYYDNNGVSEDAGLCKSQKQLDYPCDMDTACETEHAECTGTTSITCVCQSGYYDNRPLYLGGSCLLQLDLGGTCDSDLDMCKTNYSECGTGGTCDCLSGYYDDNSVLVNGGECKPQLALYSVCNETYQCATDNAVCQSNNCTCSSGFYDLNNLGTCQGPSSFYSCYPDKTSSDAEEVHFSHAEEVTDTTKCQEACFKQDKRYYKLEDNVCLCGTVDTTGSCCPSVLDLCNTRNYLGPNVGYVTTGTNITAFSKTYVGQANQFSVSTNFSIIDQLKVNYGDSDTNKMINASSVSEYHTYTHSGQFTYTVDACNIASSVCEQTEVKVNVQCTPENLTLWITGYANVGVSADMSNIFGTFPCGYDFEYYWEKKDSSSVVTKRRDCESGWTPHRQTCVKMSTTSMAYTAAAAQCTTWGGTLLKINFMDEKAEIITALSASSDQFLLDGQRVGGVWQWKSDASKTIVTSSSLTDSMAGDCLILDGSTGELSTISCTSSVKFVCMKDPVDCPHGGELQSNGHCLVLSTTLSLPDSSWTSAQTSCANIGGWLANITDDTTHTTITNMLTTESESEAWFGLSDMAVEDAYYWDDDTPHDLWGSPYVPTITSNYYDCFATSITKTWQSYDCDATKPFVCQYSQNRQRKTVPQFVTGTRDLGISGNTNIELIATDSFTATDVVTKLVLFPGMIVTKTATARSVIFKPVSGLSTAKEISVQVFEPSCPSGQFRVQAGCGGTKFDSCKASSMTCTAPTTCSDDQSFCFLSNTCKSFKESCTCTSETSSFATTACSSIGTMPIYTSKGQAQATPSSDGVFTVTAGDFSIAPGDVLGIQYRDGHEVIKCEDAPSNTAQQTSYQASYTGWLLKGAEWPTDSKTDVDTTCYLQLISSADVNDYLPQNLGFSTTTGDYELSLTIIEGDYKSLSVLLEEPVTLDDVSWVYPAIDVPSPDPTSNYAGTSYTELYQTYDLTVVAERGTNLQTTWSLSGTPTSTFGSSCTSDVLSAVGQTCNASLIWSNTPFSYYNFNASAVGSLNLSATISNVLGSVTKSITLQTEERLSGVTFELTTSALIANNVKVSEAATFVTSIAKGTGETYLYYVNETLVPSTAASLSHTFDAIGTYDIEVQVKNPLSTETTSLTIYVKNPAEFLSCTFAGGPYTAATGLPITFTFQCTVNTNAQVSLTWMRSDGAANETTATETTSTTTVTWTKTVTFTSYNLGITLTGVATDPFTEVSQSTTVDVYNAVPPIELTVSSDQVSVAEDFTFNSSLPTSPGNYGTVLYAFDYDDGTTDSSSTGIVTHSYASAGLYNATITAANGGSSASKVQQIYVYTPITGLSFTDDGPTKKNSPTTFTATKSTGNFETYRFVCSEFDVTQDSGVFSHSFASASIYSVTVICSNAKSEQNVTLSTHILEATDLTIVSLQRNSADITGCIETGINDNYEVDVIHYDATNLEYDWNFGEGTDRPGATSSQSFGYTSAGNFTLQVTARYPTESSSDVFTKEICGQERISSISISLSSIVNLPEIGYMDLDVTYSVATGSPLSSLWSTNASNVLSSNTAPSFKVHIVSEGYLNFAVTLSNEINSLSTSTTVRVAQVISGLSIDCAGCTSKDGAFYVTKDNLNTFNVSTSTGSIVSFTWDFGDSSASVPGIQVAKTYTSLGNFSLTVTATNEIADTASTVVDVYVEETLTLASITPNNLMDWTDNHDKSHNLKNIDITTTAVLQATISPTGMTSLVYNWECDNVAETQTTQTLSKNFTSTGRKSCTVVVSNSINSVTATAYGFFVIEELTQVNIVMDTGVQLQLDPTINYVAQNRNYTFTASSTQIVTDTVYYFFVIKKGTAFDGSSSLNSAQNYINYIFRDDTASYSVQVEVRNSIGSKIVLAYIDVIAPISSPVITPPAGADGNFTLGSSIQLAGSATGDSPEFSWRLSAAPSGESLPSNDSSDLTFTPGTVGQYIVTLAVSNAVTELSVEVNYTINVMVGVSGVAILKTIPHPPDAIQTGSSLEFEASVTAGTGLSYNWNVNVGGVSVSTTTTQKLIYSFTSQGEYNITLRVSNYASEGSSFTIIYSLNPMTDFTLSTNAVYESTITKYVAESNTNTTFSNSISNTEFMTFVWTIDNVVSGTESTSWSVFDTPGSYVVKLQAINTIESKNAQIEVLIQDAIVNFSVSPCVQSYLLDTEITMISTQDEGTDVQVEFDREMLRTDSGSTGITELTYSTPGEYTVNITGSNYVSTQVQYCVITIQGMITNLHVTKSLYDKYVAYPIPFTITGDYIDPASFEFAFSDGTKQTTNVPTLNKTFVAEGNYTLTVTVSNDISSSSVTLDFEVEELLCKVPVLTVGGSISTRYNRLRSRGMEFAVSVAVTPGCPNYTSEHKWSLYQVGFCSESLPSETTLNVAVNTPILQVPGATLVYGDYCIVFQNKYQNTPVVQYQYFNVTVMMSNLMALVKGGDEIVASEGTTLTLDASDSYDPDQASGTTLLYSWDCTHSMTSSDADAVCTAVKAMSSAKDTLTGLTLTSGDIYMVTVTVSATGRTSSTAPQKVSIKSNGTPVMSIDCVSCGAINSFCVGKDIQITLEVTCTGCTTTTTYQWTVTKTTTGVTVDIDSLYTTTGTTSKNLVILAGFLESGIEYTFMVEATDNSKTGSSQISLEPCTVPSGGTCSISPSNVVPLQTQLTAVCQNWSDLDLMSGLYYKIVVTGTGQDDIVVYYGTRSTYEFYVSPYAGSTMASVDVKVYVMNDFGAEVHALTWTVGFTEPTLLSTQTDLVDYIVDDMISDMKTIVNQNNPMRHKEYCIAVLNYLNYLSYNSLGNVTKRAAIREYIATALSGIPLSTIWESTIWEISQLSSAIQYLSLYSEELTSDVLSLISGEIEMGTTQLSADAEQGKDEEDFNTYSFMKAVNSVQEALTSTATVTSDTATQTKLGLKSDYTLAVSSPTTTTYTSEALILKSMDLSVDLMIVQLKTKITGEDPIEEVFGINSKMMGVHLDKDSSVPEFNTSGVSLKVGNVISQTGYTGSSYYSITMASPTNVLENGMPEGFGDFTYTVSTSLHEPSGADIAVNGLPDDSNVIMYLFDNDTTTYSIGTDITNSTEYDPYAKLNVTKSNIEANKNYVTTIVLPTETGTSISVALMPNITSGSVSVTLYKNDVAIPASYSVPSMRPKDITMEMMQNNQHDHRDYTFFIPPSEISSDVAFKVQISPESDGVMLASTYYHRCNYYDLTQSSWQSTGCQPTAWSIPTVAMCECDHMTSYGGSLLISPDQIDFTDLTVIDILSNPVSIITCSVILFLYIVLAIICRRLDILDLKRISLIPLCGKDGSFKYEVTVVTGRLPGAGTSGHVGVRIIGEYGKSARQHIIKNGAFKRNCSDTFLIAYDVNLGDLRKIHIWHDNSGLSPSWYLSYVIVNDLQTDIKYYFYANTWLSLEMENGAIQKELTVASPEERDKFGHRMTTAMFNSLADKHLWISLLNRPAQSRFTRVQRITCCITILYVFIGVNAMWYGLLRTENEDLGWVDFGWEEIVLAIVSNIMVFPISVALIFLFKKSRSKSNFFDHVQKPLTAQTLEIENLCGNSQDGSFNSQNTGAVPEDLERESTFASDSVPHNLLGLHRSRHVAHSRAIQHRENTDDSIKRPSISVTHASAKTPLWNQDNIMKWPEAMSYEDGSRPSTAASTVQGQPIRQPPPKPGGSTPANKKSKSIKGKADSDQLLEYLDQMEDDLKEVETKSVKSSGSKRSIHSGLPSTSRKPSLANSRWGDLEDILHSDDESVADSSKSGKRPYKKRGSTTSQTGVKFNPRSDPKINGNRGVWPRPAGSMISGQTGDSFTEGPSGVTDGIRPGYYNEMTMESHDIRPIPIFKEKCTLPSWCVYVAYTLCLLLCVFSIIIVILYCFKFGFHESIEWVLACLLSLVLSICVIEPLKAVIIAMYVVAMVKHVEQDEDEDKIDIEPTFDNSNEKIKDVKFKPISGFALLQAKEEGRKIHRMNIMIRQTIAYLFYLLLLMVIVYINFDYHSYLLNKHMKQDFVNTTSPSFVSFDNITSIEEYWDWSENVLADSLHLQDSMIDEEHGYLLGPARMRLIRSTEAKCQAAAAAARHGASSLTDRICYGDTGYEEDTEPYGERWNDSLYNKSWKYNTASQLGGSHKVGHVATYGGGGYPQVLGTSQSETLTIIQDLKEKGWIDLRTRAVILEFSVYSPGTDMTAMMAFMAEFPLTGGVLTSYEIQSQKLLWFMNNRVDPLMVMEIILFLVIIYSLVHIVQLIRDKGKTYFKDVWNWYEMLTTLMTVVSIGMYIGCVVEATNTFNHHIDDPTGFTNFERVTYVHLGMRYLHAWLLFLLMFKVVNQLRFIKFLYVYGKTISAAAGQLLGSGLIYIILLLIYAQLGYLMYGRVVAGFESVGHSITTLVVMIRGTFDFWPMLDYQPVFSHFYVFSYYAFAYGILIALVFSILTSTYRMTKSKMYYKSTLEMQDYEMVDFMLKRFKLWAGIQKPKPAFRHVRFPGLPSIPSSRSSSSYSSRSSASLQSSQSISAPEYSQVQLNSMLARLVPTWNAVLKRFDKIEALEKEEESLVKETEVKMKDLNWNCRINQLEREHHDILTSTSAKPPVGDANQRQSILKRLANRDNLSSERKAPATVSGVMTRASATPPSSKDNKISQGRRPLSDQGARAAEPPARTTTPEKSKIQKFFKSIKPSKSAWNK